MHFFRYFFVVTFTLLPSLCMGMMSNGDYALISEQQPVLHHDNQLTVLSNQIKNLFLNIEKMKTQLTDMLSLKSLYALHKEGASLQAIDWYCSRLGTFGSDAIKNQGLLVYSGLTLSRECNDILAALEVLAIENPLLSVLSSMVKNSHMKLKSSIIQAYNHLDDYGKYSFASYFYELEPELFFGDCKATDEIIRINLEFAARAKRGFMNELNISLSTQF